MNESMEWIKIDGYKCIDKWMLLRAQIPDKIFCIGTPD
jgi:hypothetical protein